VYIPPTFAESNPQTLSAFIEQHSFAVLVSDTGGEPFASHLPLLLDRTAGPQGTLLGHMARADPHWQHADGRRVLAVFTGPHAYVSPTWYEAEGTVPTWNYAAVHAYGTFRRIDDPTEALRIIAATVQQYESSMPTPWQFDPEAEVSRRLLQAIVPFRIELDRLEGKWKLGQNHPPERREKVIRALARSADPQARDTAALMRETLAK
jgi:transcriptional regulator